MSKSKLLKDDWIFLGEGSFNKVYKSKDGKEILKIQKDLSDSTDTPERSVRLWNAINSHLSPPARLEGLGWVCPFIEGVQASDKEMADALIDIFNKTGRVVVDATARKNFIRTPAGETVCIDIGMALQFERREDKHFAEIRRKSRVSLEAWKDLEDVYKPFLTECAKKNPTTVNVVKALVFIKDNRPDLYDATFLKTNPDLVDKLAIAYNVQKKEFLADLDQVVKGSAAKSGLFSASEKNASQPAPDASEPKP